MLLVLVLAGIGLGVYLVQHRTNIFPRASISEPIAPKTGFTLTATDDIVSPNSEFYVKVTANSDFDEANLFSLVMNYPSDKVQMLDISPSMNGGTPSAGTFIKKWIEQSDDKNGKIVLSGAIPNPGFKTNVGTPASMVVIRFKVIANTGSIILDVNEESGIYRNSDNQNIMVTNIGAQVKIGVAPSVIPSVDSDNDGFLDTDEFFYGTDPGKSCGINAWPPDMTNDEVVNFLDASFMVPFINGTNPYSKRYDLDRNGKISEDDAFIIQKYFSKSCTVPVSSPSPVPSSAPVIDGKRADLYKDPNKPNFVNDQDISVFYSKCAAKGVELFGQPASVQPICDILEDGKITVSDWAVLIKFRNKQV